MFGFFKRQRRDAIRQQPFPPEWREVIEKRFVYFTHLPEADQQKLLELVQVFVAEKRFEGCGGLEITDEIRITISAQACLLLLNRDDEDFYPKMKTIFIYPHHYFATQKQIGTGGLVTEGPSGRLGESWYRGPVVLSWDDARNGAADHNDGHNVVFHEFAHQLDSESGQTNGAPLLDRKSQYIAWARVLGQEYSHLLDDIEHHRKTDIDPYGATNPAEFFAVTTECFFEKPEKLRRKHPALYDQLKTFYHQDPADALAGSPCGDTHAR
jgi:MtfA peptidase